jgi:Glycosyltransferase family 87
VNAVSVVRWSERPLGTRASVVAAALALAVLVVAFEIAKRPAGAVAGSDVGVFESYGSRMLDRELPYRDFRMEYPPAAAAMFVLPGTRVLAGGSTEAASWNLPNEPARRYYRGFTLLVLLLTAAIVVLTAASMRALRRPAYGTVLALGLIALSPLVLERLLTERFDAWPAALTAAAIAAALRDHFRLGGALLGLGAAAKLYPALFLPVLAVAALRLRGIREAVACALSALAVAAAVFVPFAVASLTGTWDSLRLQFQSGLQIESLASSVLVLSGHVLGSPSPSELTTQGAGGGLIRIDLAGPGVATAETVMHVLVVVVVAAIWVGLLRSKRDPRDDLALYAAATLASVLVLGTVLSPQYLVWLLPLVPLVGGWRGAVAILAFAVALVLTDVWIPDTYLEYQDDLGAGPASLLLARNLALLAIPVALLAPGLRLQRYAAA